MNIIQPISFEQWKPITELSVPNVRANAYMVSNTGKVYSNLSNSFLSLVPTWNGYYRVFLKLQNGKGRYFLIHRIVMIEFHYIDNYQEMQVDHKDCDKSFNNDKNLEWVTPSENIIRAYQKGVKIKEKGENCSYATITNEQAEKIAKLLVEQKYSHKEIADIVGCNCNIVSSISSGSTWQDIYNKYNLCNYKRESRPGFSDEELNKLCKYFETNKNNYDKNSDLYRAALKDLFNINYNNSMSASMSRIFNHKTRKDITDKYIF